LRLPLDFYHYICNTIIMKTTNTKQLDKAAHKNLADRAIKRLQALDLCVPPARWTGKAWLLHVEEYDSSEDGDGARYLGDVVINANGNFQIDPPVQRAIDKAKK